MKWIGFGSQGVVRFGASSLQDDQPSAGFEESAMPQFDSLYNFARCWFTIPATPRISYKRPIARLYAISLRVSPAPISGRGCFES